MFRFLLTAPSEKRYKDAARNARTSAEDASRSAELAASSQPTGPLAELCADIVANPDCYDLDTSSAYRLQCQADPKLWIQVNSNRREYAYPISCCFRKYTATDDDLILQTINCFFSHAARLRKEKEDARDADLAQRLAKVKAEREQSALAPLFDTSLTDMLIKYGITLSEAVATLTPVLEGKARIVPVDDAKTTRIPPGPVTICTHTPGDDRPVMGDFPTDTRLRIQLTEGMTRKSGQNIGPSQIKERPPAPAPMQTWTDLHGKPYRTRKERSEADRAIMRAGSLGTGDQEPPMWYDPPMPKGG